MTLDEFKKKYGTETASLVLEKLVDEVYNETCCMSGRMRDLLDETSCLAKDLRSLLGSHT